MAFKDRLKEARIKRGFTQEQLASFIGIAKSTVTGYEKGSREPDMAKIYQMMAVLQVDANYLWQDEMSVTKKEPPLEYGDSNRIELVENYDNMNETGQFELLKHSRLLLSSDQYKKCDEFGHNQEIA